VLGFGKGIRAGKTLFVAAIADLASPAFTAFELPFFGHGVAFDPARPSRAMVFEKKGAGACEVDLVARRVVRPIPAGKGRTFYGHGTFTAEGKALLTVEIDAASHGGRIVIRDASDLRVLGEFPTYGDDPHDARLTAGGKVLVVTNGGKRGGAAPCVSFVDVASQRLLEQVRPASETLNTGHVALDPAGDLVIVSAPHPALAPDQPGGVTLRAAGGSPVLGQLPEGLGPLTGEALSVVLLPERHVAATTHPDAGLVIFWELRRGTYLAHLRLTHPRGLAATAGGTHLVVSHDDGKLLLVDTATLQPVRSPERDGTPFGGSHLHLLA
jgi:hypothetical protein